VSNGVRQNTRGVRVRRRSWRAAALALITIGITVPLTAGSTTPAFSAGGPSDPPSAVVAPNSLLGNQQVVTVDWSGLQPTAASINPVTQYRDDDVAILECAAHPPGGIWYFFRDCYTQGENLGGNIVAPSGGIQDSEVPLVGATSADGTGTYPFQVQEGTLQTQEVDFPCSGGYSPPQCNNPYNLQCDSSNPCVLKVVDLPDGDMPIPNELWQGPPSPAQVAKCAKKATKCTLSQLLDAAPSAALDFGPIPNCPGTGTGNLAIEGAASSSYALESWAAQLCTGSKPVTLSYSDLGENLAKQDLLSGATTIGVASLPPTAAQQAARTIPGELAAPLDAAGVSIVFNMVDPLTGLPIGCSPNQPISQCATPVRLTPRLVAMLITNSATLNAQEPFGHFAAGSTTRFVEPLTADPEFQALNPGFQPPAICTSSGKKNHPTVTCADNVEEPVLRAEQNDDTYILTQWIADDYDARQFLAGRDICGAKLNQDWTGVTYPSDKFVELAHSSSGTTPDSDSYYPETGTSTVLENLLYGIPVGGPPASEGAPKTWLPAPTDDYAFFGVVDTVSAHRSGLPSAELIAADPNGSELSRFVSEQGGTCTPLPDPSTAGFVADNQAGLDEAYQTMATNADGMVVPPVATTDPDAYPLAKIDYALVPSGGLTTEQKSLVDTLLGFAAGPGQSSQYLPAGYVPLPAGLEAQTLAIARKVAAEPTDSTPLLANGPTTTIQSTAPSPTISSSPTAQQSSDTSPTSPSSEPPPANLGGGAPARSLHESAIVVAAADLLSGGWLIPLAAGLAVGFALAGVILSRRRSPRSVKV
jgi:hypothetical protein